MVVADKTRDFANQIDRVPAAPGALHVIREYHLQGNANINFEQRWEAFAAKASQQAGCAFARLHRDSADAGRYLSDEAWQSRQSLIAALPEIENPPGQTSLTFVRLRAHIRGAQADIVRAVPGQVASLRIFSIKVEALRQFERLWTQSARAEAHQRGCLYKRLYVDLNLPTRYVSYSLWANAAAPDEAASKHSHWQSQHKPYPLGSPVIRAYWEVCANVIGSQ